MNILEQIDELINSEKQWARDRAEAAKAIHQQYCKGNLTDSEYKELLEDLVRTRKLDMDADEIELRSNLVNTISGLLRVI